MAAPLLMGMVVGVAVIIFIMVAREQRRARTSTFLWVLAIAARHNRPLPGEVALLAETTAGRVRQDLQNLAAMLDIGDALPVALERARVPVPQSAIVAAQVGVQTGALASALGDAAREQTQRRIGSLRGALDVGGALLYLWVLALIVFFIITFLGYWIVPKFRDIFADFGVALPPITRLFAEAAPLASALGVLLMPVLLFPAFLILAAAIACWKGRDPFDLGWIGRWSVRWEAPTILRGLSHAVTANAPLAEGLAAIQDTHTRGKVRRRVGEALHALESGEDCWLALRRQGIVRRAEARLLQAAERTGDLSWALRELASSIENRRRYRGLVFLELLQPALVILIGAGVLLVCVAFFLPLVELVQRLS
jgi:type II secretory pathway component PulF